MNPTTTPAEAQLLRELDQVAHRLSGLKTEQEQELGSIQLQGWMKKYYEAAATDEYFTRFNQLMAQLKALRTELHKLRHARRNSHSLVQATIASIVRHEKRLDEVQTLTFDYLNRQRNLKKQLQALREPKTTRTRSTRSTRTTFSLEQLAKLKARGIDPAEMLELLA